MKAHLIPGVSGAALALMAAGLAVSSPATATGAKDKATGSVVELVHCSGVNSCKGHNDCKTASNACKGQASCKGHGFVALPAATCANIGGTAG